MNPTLADLTVAVESYPVPQLASVYPNTRDNHLKLLVHYQKIRVTRRHADPIHSAHYSVVVLPSAPAYLDLLKAQIRFADA